jgi:hypothetical protein
MVVGDAMAEETFAKLGGKFKPLADEIERRGARVEMLELRANKLFLRAETQSPDDHDAIWNRIQELDPDMNELDAVISIRGGSSLRSERPTGEAEHSRAANEGHRGAGDRRPPTGIST